MMARLISPPVFAIVMYLYCRDRGLSEDAAWSCAEILRKEFAGRTVSSDWEADLDEFHSRAAALVEEWNR